MINDSVLIFAKRYIAYLCVFHKQMPFRHFGDAYNAYHLWNIFQIIQCNNYFLYRISKGPQSAQNITSVYINFNELFDYFHSIQKQSDEYRLMKMINHNRNGAQPQNQNSYTISNENRSNRGSLGNVFNKLAVSDEKPSDNIYPTDIQMKIDPKITVCSANDYLTAVNLFAPCNIVLIIFVN
ncbi:unnamed protein product [Schistosoma mattheei]|uniref:Uncharacterized protein n=1 Tax=Schistosoma mattheei TaxID=31246 RepID=A0A3P8EAL8_9TREM|nr:unnamed protein product [Schistosoma mattheei]